MEWMKILEMILEVLSNITDLKEELNITPEIMIAGAITLVVVVFVIIFWGDLKKRVEIIVIAITAMIAIILPFMEIINPYWAIGILAILFLIAFRDYLGLAIRIGVVGLLSIFLISLVLIAMFSEPLHESLEGGLQAYEKYQTAEAAYDYVSDAVDNFEEDPTGTGVKIVKDGWNSAVEWWNKSGRFSK